MESGKKLVSSVKYKMNVIPAKAGIHHNFEICTKAISNFHYKDKNIILLNDTINNNLLESMGGYLVSIKPCHFERAKRGEIYYNQYLDFSFRYIGTRNDSNSYLLDSPDILVRLF